MRDNLNEREMGSSTINLGKVAARDNPLRGLTQSQLTTKPAPTKVVPTPRPVANCSADSFNCSDFSSCSEVMSVFNACPGDPHGLDGDDDGVPCESLRS